MAVMISEIQRESWPAARMIGKKHEAEPNWNEWWQNDWFAALEKNAPLAIGGDAYLGAVRVVNGKPERWIGMLFPVDAPVPDGFEAVDLEPLDYAVCYLYGKQDSADFYTMVTHQLCLEALRTQGYKRRENSWCFERYQCPRFTTPDENGNVILDYAISVEKCMD